MPTKVLFDRLDKVSDTHKMSLDGRSRQSWPTGRAVRVGPPSPDEAPVPVEDRLWRDELRAPPFTRNKVRHQRTIGPGELRSLCLASENGELVAQHEDLRFLRGYVLAVRTSSKA